MAKAKTKIVKAKTKKKSIDQLLKESAIVKLDLACGANKQGKDFIGMDMFPYPGVDIVHNALNFPWPLPDKSVNMIVASHFLEHVSASGIDPHLSDLIDLLIKNKILKEKEITDLMGEHRIFSNFIRLLDECWRVLKVGGQMAFVGPYYQSIGAAQDPTHVKPLCEASMLYFDPEECGGLFWNFYKPKPWKLEMQSFEGSGNIEVIISKRDIKPYEERIKSHLEVEN